MAESEETFLEMLDQNPLPWRVLLSSIEVIAAQGGLAQAEERAHLLEDALVAAKELDAALSVMETRAGWTPSAERRPLLARRAEAFLHEAPERKFLIGEAGFDRALPPAECVRRLRTLLGLAPGVLCYEATWRFGVVRRVDLLGRRVEIDFEIKKGHSMVLAYAAETIQLLPPEHLMARFHREPDSIRALIRNSPAEVVVLALKSFGSISLSSLQEKLVPGILEAADWKLFWETARKALKKDGHVVLPAKRTERMVFRQEGEDDFGRIWFSTLAAERDMRKILDRIESLCNARKPEDLDVDLKKTIEERLAFVLKGAEPGRWDYWARALRLAFACGVEGAGIQFTNRLQRFENERDFFTIINSSSAREIEPLLDMLHQKRGESFRKQMLAWLPKMDIGVLSAVIPLLCSAGGSDTCAAVIRDQISKQSASVNLLLWIHRNPTCIQEWKLGSLPALARQTIHQLEASAHGALLRSQNQLRDRFVQAEWLHAVVESMTENQRREFLDRMKTTSAWPNLERLAALGCIIKKFPELEQLMSTSRSATDSPGKGPLTSRRSYRSRQEALEKIVREEIPANSREIGVARSHGDLRENAEYKAAKDHQSVLFRRRTELQQQLREVQPSDLEGFPTDRAGLATGVDVEYADGRKERLYILGAWDRDEGLGIISMDTRLAQSISGKTAGESFEWSAEHGVEKGILRAIVPLPETIWEWIREYDGKS